MSRAAAAFTKQLERQAQQATRTAAETATIKGALLGLDDATLSVVQKAGAAGAAFAALGSGGARAVASVGSAAAGTSEKISALLATMVGKMRDVNSQTQALKAEAVAQNASGALTDDGLKVRLAGINAEREAMVRRLNVAYDEDKAAIKLAAVKAAERAAAARDEKAASSRAVAQAVAGSNSATSEAQARVYLAFAAAQAKAAEITAAAQAREAQVLDAIAAASSRSRAEQVSAYEVKTAYIARVNEETAALFRTRDAQRALDAERAGVSQKEAAQLAKVQGDREFIASIYQRIGAEQKVASEMGKTTAEILRQQAAERGLVNTTAGQIARLEALTKANKDAAAAAEQRKAAETFLASLNQRAAGINPDGSQKAQSQLLAERAAILGVGAEAQAAIAKIAALDAKTGQLGKGAFATRNQLLTLQYTISDVIASAATGISPLTILLQQGPQVAQVEGGIKGVFQSAISLVTPFRAAMGAAAAGVGLLTYAWFEGHKQSKAFADGMVLSGNFAGQTEGQFNSLTRTVAASGQVTAAAAREFGQALIATGEVGPEVFDKATRAAALYGQATGKNAKEVAQDFASMAQDAGKWATEHNRAMNFVSAAQLDQIKNLQDAGRATEAQALIYDALNGKLTKLSDNLNDFEKVLRGVTREWGRFWDAAFDTGRTKTVDDEIADLEKKIAAFEERRRSAAKPGEGFQIPGQAPGAVSAAAGQALKDELRTKLRQKDILDAAAAATAATAKLNKEASAADAFVDSFDRRTKSVAAMNRELDAANAKFAAQDRLAATDPAYKASDSYKQSQANRGAILADIRKSYTDRRAVTQANDDRKAELAKDLQVYAEALAREKDVLRFHQDELRAIYDAGGASLAQFYDQREAIVRSGTEKELAAQRQAAERLQQELDRGKFKAPADRTDAERQLAEAKAKAANIERDAANAAVLATYERAAAYKALGREVDNFRANILRLQGDEAGAARLQAKASNEDAMRFALRASPTESAGDFARMDRGQGASQSVALRQQAVAQAELTEASIQFAEVQRKVGVATADVSRAEEAYLLRAKIGGVSLAEQDRAVYTIRAASLVQLGELTEAARKLADASTDPKVKAYADDLALQYAKAADAVDPALTRLKANADDLGASLASTFGSALGKAQSLKDKLYGLGDVVQQSLTKALVTDPLTQYLQSGIRGIATGGGFIGSILQSAGGVSSGSAGAEAAAKVSVTAATASQTVATQAATVGMAQLTAAATSASAALLALSGSGSVSSLVGSGLNVFGGLNSLGFGSGAGYGNMDLGLFLHSGGIVGQGGSIRAVAPAVFNGASRYHAGGMAAGGAVATLQANEVPAILMGGPKGTREEVLHASDPRHRDNFGALMVRAFQAGAAGFGRPVARYHTGGIAGMGPDAHPTVMRGGFSATAVDRRTSAAGAGDGLRPLVQNFHFASPVDRRTQMQVGADAARGAARANARNN